MKEIHIEFPENLRFDAVRVLSNTFVTDTSVQNRVAFEAYKQPFNYEAHKKSNQIAWVLTHIVTYCSALKAVSNFTDFKYWVKSINQNIVLLTEAKEWYLENKVYSWQSAVALADLRLEQLAWIKAQFRALKRLISDQEYVKVTTNLTK